MIATILRRLVSGAIMLVAVLSLVFLTLHLAPGEPLAHLSDPRLPASSVAALRRIWGLDDPLLVRWWRWLAASLQGDWGTSFLHQEPVSRVVGRAVGPTLLLGGAASLLQLGLGFGLGLIAALGRQRWPDRLVRFGSLVAYSVPTFWLALLAILAFSMHWPHLPSSHLASPGAASWSTGARLLDLSRHLILPATVLGLSTAGLAMRLSRNALIEVLASPWLLAARARGLSRRQALLRHGLRNAAAPLLQLLAVQVPALLGGALVVEIVFAWPGLGRVAYDALTAGDLPLVLATTSVACALVVGGALLADLLQLAIDPRLRDSVIVEATP